MSIWERTWAVAMLAHVATVAAPCTIPCLGGTGAWVRHIVTTTTTRPLLAPSKISFTRARVTTSRPPFLECFIVVLPVRLPHHSAAFRIARAPILMARKYKCSAAEWGAGKPGSSTASFWDAPRLMRDCSISEALAHSAHFQHREKNLAKEPHASRF